MISKIEELCKKKGITMYKLSCETGVSQQALSIQKKRNGSLSAENLFKIAKYFDVPMEYFVEGR